MATDGLALRYVALRGNSGKQPHMATDTERSHFERKLGMHWLTPQESDALSILNRENEGPDPAHDSDNVNMVAGLLRLLNEGPGHLLTLHKTLERIAAKVDVLAGPFLWANCADVSNGAVTALGSAAYSPAFTGYTQQQACVLKNIFVGCSAAAVIQVIKVRDGGGAAVPLLSSMPQVTLTTVRITAQVLTSWCPGEFLVEQGYNVYLYIPAGGSPTVDFSCDYRQLPDM